MPHTLGIYTLGCKVNQYESEALAEAAETDGFIVTDTSLPCDVYIINTCTVTAESDRKSRQIIRRARTTNPDAKIIVTGCLTQVNPSAVAKIEGVDYICGSRNKLDTVRAAKRLVGLEKPEKPLIEVYPTALSGFEQMCISRFPRTRAYIKIEDGCESNCSYCIIPQSRGKICSKPRDEVLAEVRRLADAGCREVVLTGIETAAYGLDLDGYRLINLLSDVDIIASGRMRIRLGSLDPSLIRPSFVEKISELTSLAPHFHLSMQSGCNRTLAAMKRRYNAETAYSGIELLRSVLPDVQFTADFITGFPTETEADFDETLAFVEEVGFLNAHIFSYSRRAGTPAAELPQVPPEVAKLRTTRLIDRQNLITERIFAGLGGKCFEVLFETDENGFSVGHTPAFVEVRVRSDKPLHATVRQVLLGTAENGIINGELLPDNQ